MISYSSNIRVIVKAKLNQIQELQNNADPILRTVALTILPELKKRVHIDGKDSNGQLIGNYSSGYMVLRTGAYKNADVYKKGKNAGKNKNAGRYTKGLVGFEQGGFAIMEPLAGKSRTEYHRTADTKVILSLTRQMENDLSVIDTPTGYGIGYLNPLNYKKAIWCEATYKKKILTALTKEELDLAKKTAEEFLPEYLKNIN